MIIGVAGTSHIVDAFLQAAQSVSGVDVKALFSRDPQGVRAQQIKCDYNIARLYSSLDDLCSDQDIDMIYITSPNGLHYDYAMKAIRAGKNVIVEKPFTSTGMEAADLLRTAKKERRMLFEGISNIHLPNYKRIGILLHEIGNVRLVLLNYSQYSRRYMQFISGETPNIFNPIFSGGCLQDINVYNVHFVMRLFGVPDKTKYFPNIHPNGIDTSGVLILQYPDFVATLVASKESEGSNMAYIQGDRGFLSVKNGASGCSEITITNYSSGNSTTYNEHEGDNRLIYEIRDFQEIVESHNYESCYSLAEHSILVMKTMTSARTEAGILFPEDHRIL